MAIRLKRKQNLITSTSGGETLSRTEHYHGLGTTSEQLLRAYTEAALPMIRQTVQGDLYRGNIEINQRAYNQFDVDVQFTSFKQVVGDWRFENDTSGGTELVHWGLEQIACYANQAEGYFEYDDEGFLGEEGAEKIVPYGRRCVHFKHPAGVINLSYANFLDSLYGMVNSTVFMGKDAGEVQFAGWHGAVGSNIETELDYYFNVAKNHTNLPVGPFTGISIKAFEHARIVKRVTERTDTNGKKVPSEKVTHVFIVRKYPTGNLAQLLGFG